MPTPTRSRILKVTRSSCTSAGGQSTLSRRRLGTPSALRLRGAASRIRFSNPPLNPRTHPGRGGVHEEADPEQVGLFFLGRVLKNPASHLPSPAIFLHPPDPPIASQSISRDALSPSRVLRSLRGSTSIYFSDRTNWMSP